MIDHSLLHPTMTDSEIAAGIELAKKYDVATACVKPYSIPQAVKQLAGTDVKVDLNNWPIRSRFALTNPRFVQ